MADADRTTPPGDGPVSFTIDTHRGAIRPDRRAQPRARPGDRRRGALRPLPSAEPGAPASVGGCAGSTPARRPGSGARPWPVSRRPAGRSSSGRASPCPWRRFDAWRQRRAATSPVRVFVEPRDAHRRRRDMRIRVKRSGAAAPRHGGWPPAPSRRTRPSAASWPAPRWRASAGASKATAEAAPSGRLPAPRFDIPAGPLADALAAFGARHGLAVTLPARAASPASTPPASAAFSPPTGPWPSS